MQTRRRIIVYVDGFNLYFRRLRNTPYRWLDLVALFKQKFPDDDVVAVRYFTARVGGKFDPLKPVRQQAYLRALASTPLVKIHYGNFLTKPARYKLIEPIINADGAVYESVDVWRPEEKGSDVNLGVHMLNDAWKDSFDVAAVVTNDTDLVEPMKLVTELGKKVFIVHPDANPARSLVQYATYRVWLHDSDLRAAQLPDAIELASGKIVHKPNGF